MIKLVLLTSVFCLNQNIMAAQPTGAKVGIIDSGIIMQTADLIKPYQDEIANVQRQQEEHIKNLD